MAIHDAADNSFKLIFGNHRLFLDFLKDFVKIDILNEVKPEDIEDLSERFLPLFQEKRDSDTVKRIKLKGTPFFVIAILEHESEVNYRTSFKMLQDKLRDSGGENLLTHLPPDYVEKLNLQIPDNMVKLLSDVIRVLLDKSRIDRQTAGKLVDYLKKDDKKEYQGMFEAAAESIIKAREAARQQGLEQGLKQGLEQSQESITNIARKALSKGIPMETIQYITGLDMDAISRLQKA